MDHEMVAVEEKLVPTAMAVPIMERNCPSAERASRPAVPGMPGALLAKQSRGFWPGSVSALATDPLPAPTGSGAVWTHTPAGVYSSRNTGAAPSPSATTPLPTRLTTRLPGVKPLITYVGLGVKVGVPVVERVDVGVPEEVREGVGVCVGVTLGVAVFVGVRELVAEELAVTVTDGEAVCEAVMELDTPELNDADGVAVVDAVREVVGVEVVVPVEEALLVWLGVMGGVTVGVAVGGKYPVL